jgi:hypothetical protein
MSSQIAIPSRSPPKLTMVRESALSNHRASSKTSYVGRSVLACVWTIFPSKMSDATFSRPLPGRDRFLSTYPTMIPIPFGAPAWRLRSAFRVSSTKRSYSSRSIGG